MIFIHLGKMRKKPDKEDVGDAAKLVAAFDKKGIKVLNWYWTLGRYDTVFIFEAKNEKEAMKMSIDVSEWVASETLIAIPRQEAVKLI
jgi:uncharacterized protein with GYD domain